MTEFRTSIEIHATPDEVFDFLVTARGVTSWMGEHAVIEPEPGGTFHVDIAGSPIRGEYLEVTRPVRVVVSWGVAGSSELPSGASQVSLELTPIASGTRVELVHSGLPDLRVAGHVEGWNHFLPRLAAAARGEALGDDPWRPLPQFDGV